MTELIKQQTLSPWGASINQMRRASYYMFALSGVGVIVSILISASLQNPDLPGFVLITTAILGVILGVVRRHELDYQVLTAIAAAFIVCLIAHEICHRLGVNHVWLEFVNMALLVIYVPLSIKPLLGLLRDGAKKAKSE